MTFMAIKNVEVVDGYGLSLVSIGNKLFAFPKRVNSTLKRFHIYDVLKDQWCVKENDLLVGSCSKLSVV